MKKEEFGELVIKNEVQLYRIAKSILKRDEDCADAAQEAITRAFENLPSLREDAYAKTWLIRILLHECYRLLEKRQRETALPEGWDVRAPERESHSGLYEALQRLPAEFRLALTLHYLEGFSVSEIAVLLEISEGTVKSRLSRGREKAIEVTEIAEIEGAPDNTDITDASTASVLTDWTLTDGVYAASAPFLVALPAPELTELTLTLTTHDSAEADTPNPTVTLLGTPIQLTLDSQ